MSKRPKSRSEQRNGKKQKPKIAASETPAAIKREDAPVALAPQAPAPQTPAPKPRPYALDNAVDTMERSLLAAGQGTVAVNRKLIDFAQANVNSGLDHVKDLAAARNPVRIMRLQMEYWHDCLATFASQAQELRALSAELVANANEPIRRHVRSLRAKAA